MLKQIPNQLFESECKRAKIFVDNEMPLGALHDFLMCIKGNIVDRMVTAQKQEEAYAEEQKKENECAEEQNKDSCCPE